MRTLTRFVLLALVLVTGWSFGQQPGADKAKTEKPTKASDRPLDEVLKTVTETHPDVQVAEAKLREAEAELRRTRAALAQQVIVRHAAVDAARSAMANAEEEYQTFLNLRNKGSAPESAVRSAKALRDKALADLALAEAALNALAGTVPGMPGPGTPAPMGGGISGIGGSGIGGIGGTFGIGGITGISGFGGAGLGGIGGGAGLSGIGGITGNLGGALGALGGGLGFGGEAPVRVPKGTMAQKIRTALDAPIKMKAINDTPLGEVVQFFQSAMPNVPMLVHLGDKKNEKISVSLSGDIALGAALQALQDIVPGLQCYVREYGILVALDGEAPADGMALIDFWHQK
jgi:hypothetical protein